MRYTPCSLQDIWETTFYFSPHGMCLLWDPWLLGAMILWNGMVAIAYLWIPLTYFRIIRLRPFVGQNPEYRRVYVWTAAFIVLCGSTHIIAIVTLFRGAWWYYVAIVAGLATGLVSLYTAWRVVPALLMILTRQETTLASLTKRLHEATGLGPEIGAVASTLDELGEVQALRKRK